MDDARARCKYVIMSPGDKRWWKEQNTTLQQLLRFKRFCEAGPESSKNVLSSWLLWNHLSFRNPFGPAFSTNILKPTMELLLANQALLFMLCWWQKLKTVSDASVTKNFEYEIKRVVNSSSCTIRSLRYFLSPCGRANLIKLRCKVSKYAANW